MKLISHIARTCCLNLMIFLPAIWAHVTTLTQDQNETFEYICGTDVRSAVDNTETILNRLQPRIHWMKPCEVCHFSHLQFYTPEDSEQNGEFLDNGTQFLSILQVKIKDYRLVCNCELHPSEQQLQHAINEIHIEHFNRSCSTVVAHYKHDLNYEKVKQCFEDPGNANPTKDEKTNVTLEGGNITINIQTVTAYPLKKGRKPGQPYLVLRQVDFDLASPPKAKCSTSDPYQKQACECLQESHFFHNIPLILLNHLLNCDKKETTGVEVFIDNEFQCSHAMGEVFDEN